MTALNRITRKYHKDQERIAEVLFNYGADGNIGDNLTHAIKRSSIDMVKILLENGANPNIIDSQGRLPLIVAIRDYHIEIVKLLIAYGADFKLQDGNGQTALEEVKDKKYIEIIEISEKTTANLKKDKRCLLS